MILPLHLQLQQRVADVLHSLYPALDSAIPPVVIEYPPSRRMGDLGTPIAFELARRLRKAPRAIAQEVAAAFGSLPGVDRVEAAANGYLNVFLDRRGFVLQRLGLAEGLPAPDVETAKTIVEHTAINPNKAAHIGHLRNAALGDTLVRVLRLRGTPVEVQNYIDDTGVQVADVVVGFRELEGMDLAAVQRIADSTRFDHYCWDLYARVTEWYSGDKARLSVRAAALHDIEHGTSATADIAQFVAERIVRCHLETMARLHIDYDLLTWEGDILRLQFWARAFEVLKETGAVFLRTEGRLAGCWVMRIEDEAGASPESVESEEATREDAAPEGEVADGDEEDQREKVIVRSNGTVTYVGKDMAYQMWKSGLLGRDFHYRVFATRQDGAPMWATTTQPQPADAAHPPFGHAAATYNVIDVRQSYLQKLLKQALVAIGHPAEAERLTHFSYEMVALSHATARELGFAPPPDSEAARKPFVEVSGRKGLGVKADDLLDRIIEKAEAQVAKGNPDLDAAERRRTAESIGVAAVRYFMIKYSRTKVIAFDIDEALSFEGESGPYLQYALVRAANIFQKAEDRLGLGRDAWLATLPDAPAEPIAGESGDELWSLVLECARLDEVVEHVIRSLEFSALAKYAFGLAQLFNAFYHKAPILSEERADLRVWRAAAVAYFHQQLSRAADVMGIAVPSRM